MASDEGKSQNSSEISASPPEPGSWWIALGFGGLGVSIGAVVGLSSAAVTLPLMAALFALIGGSIVPFLTKISSADRPVIGKALFAFTSAFTICLLLGVVTKVNGLLSFPALSLTRLTLVNRTT